MSVLVGPSDAVAVLRRTCVPREVLSVTRRRGASCSRTSLKRDMPAERGCPRPLAVDFFFGTLSAPLETRVSAFHLKDRKTEIYKNFVSDGTAVLRPGIQRLIDEARAIPVRLVFMPWLLVTAASSG